MSRVLHGWNGWGDFFKSFSRKQALRQLQSHRNESLLLYRDIERLLRRTCARYGLLHSKKAEIKFYFNESRYIEDPQDLRYFLNTMALFKDNLSKGNYPPFPRRLPSVFSPHTQRDLLLYRKHIWNIRGTDLILEPGQDPVRQPFVDSRQPQTELMNDPTYIKNDPEGTQFPEEEYLFAQNN